MKANSAAAFILPANPEYVRNNDVHYPFRQDTNLYYLTGFDEPESCLVLAPTGLESPAYQVVLFVRERVREREIWEGERYGVDRSAKIFGADLCFPIHELGKQLPGLLKHAESVHYSLGRDAETDRVVLRALEEQRSSQGRSGRGLLPLLDSRPVVGELRLRKGPEEADLLRRAGKVSALAHKTLMEQVRPGWNEFEVEALVNFTMRKNGSERLGYDSIIAGGRNATCLHYRANNEPLRDGDLLLVDAGGECDYYTADITRTFPVGRTFTSEQAQIYDIVLKAQKECVAMTRPGLTIEQLYDHAARVMMEGVEALGLLKVPAAKFISEAGHKALFPHGIGHWLGMDVHDSGIYKLGGAARKLEAGMCFTIEPGLYFQPDDAQWPEKYRGIGIRIEDDILVTPEGCEVLTAGAPKERAEIEALRAGSR
ncbi:MAG: aminopeptidase P N-terminal domain-containing protein [Bdellovibrionales bacterium]|nr:aminopeptidase P N-terminal domain-containing protein [Bdellovibrionales bacterium]